MIGKIVRQRAIFYCILWLLPMCMYKLSTNCLVYFITASEIFLCKTKRITQRWILSIKKESISIFFLEKLKLMKGFARGIIVSRFNLLPLHRKGAGVKQLRKYAKVQEKNEKLSNSNISDILLFRTRIDMIFQRKKFCLMLFYKSCFHNSFQKCLLKKYGNKLIPIKNT